MTPTRVFLPLGHPAASFVSIGTSSQNYILFHLFLMIFLYCSASRDTWLLKRTFYLHLCNLYMWILIWVALKKQKQNSCTDFTHQTFSSLQLIHISWQQMHLLTILYVLAQVLLSCKVGMETTCFSEIPVAQRCVACSLFDLITLCGKGLSCLFMKLLKC